MKAAQNQINTEALTVASKTEAKVISVEKHVDLLRDELRAQGTRLIEVNDHLIEKIDTLSDKFQISMNALLFKVIAALGASIGILVMFLKS